MATENHTNVLNNVSNLEVLAQMGKKALTSIKDFGRGYASEQLISTFNIPGYRIADKYLDSEDILDFGGMLGFVTGIAQDTITGLVSLPFITDWSCSTLLSKEPILETSSYEAVTVALIGTKIATNIGAFISSKVYDTYQSAKKQLKESKIKSEQPNKINQKWTLKILIIQN